MAGLGTQDKAYYLRIIHRPSQRWVPHWDLQFRVSGFLLEALLPLPSLLMSHLVQRCHFISRRLLYFLFAPWGSSWYNFIHCRGDAWDASLCASRWFFAHFTLPTSHKEDTCSLSPRGGPVFIYVGGSHIFLISVEWTPARSLSSNQIFLRPRGVAPFSFSRHCFSPYYLAHFDNLGDKL